MPKYVSIIGTDLVEPLVVLLERLIEFPQPDSKSGIVGSERGLCASICLLTAVIIESFTMRVRYLNESNESAGQRSLHKFIEQKYPEFPWSNELVEVFILRDVIAHNHLWKLESTNSDVWINLLKKEIHPLTDKFSGNKYKENVNLEIGRTKILGLHVIPTQIDRTDVNKVLEIASQTLKYFSKEEGPILGVQAIMLKFRGYMLDFDSILREASKAI
jgi:hypothetical protein